jgi:hypothetical protein
MMSFILVSPLTLVIEEMPNVELTDDEERAKDTRIGTCG